MLPSLEMLWIFFLHNEFKFVAWLYLECNSLLFENKSLFYLNAELDEQKNQHLRSFTVLGRDIRQILRLDIGR